MSPNYNWNIHDSNPDWLTDYSDIVFYCLPQNCLVYAYNMPRLRTSNTYPINFLHSPISLDVTGPVTFAAETRSLNNLTDIKYDCHGYNAADAVSRCSLSYLSFNLYPRAVLKWWQMSVLTCQQSNSEPSRPRYPGFYSCVILHAVTNVVSLPP